MMGAGFIQGRWLSTSQVLIDMNMSDTDEGGPMVFFIGRKRRPGVPIFFIRIADMCEQHHAESLFHHYEAKSVLLYEGTKAFIGVEMHPFYSMLTLFSMTLFVSYL